MDTSSTRAIPNGFKFKRFNPPSSGQQLFCLIHFLDNSAGQGGGLVYHGHQGRRVVAGQQMMQAASDFFLGYTQDDSSDRQFYVRTLKNHRLGGISEISEVRRFRIMHVSVAAL